MTKVSDDNPLISIIIPVYNVENYLDECIISVINQTYKNLEIILVDDGSTDNSPKICDEWQKKDNRIKVIHKKNGGLSDARNKGIALSTGKYVGFIDSDDYIDNQMYEILYNNVNKYNCEMSVCELTRKKISNDRNVKITLYSQNEYMKKFFKIDSQSIEYYATTKLYKRNILCNEQYPIGLTSEDVVGTFLALLKVKKVVKTNQKLYYYRINEESITSKFSNKDFDLIKIWDIVVEKAKGTQFYEYAIINRKRIDFTLLYRMAKNYSYKELKNNCYVNKLLGSLKNNKNDLINSGIEIKRKILIILFCKMYYLVSIFL